MTKQQQTLLHMIAGLTVIGLASHLFYIHHFQSKAIIYNGPAVQYSIQRALEIVKEKKNSYITPIT